MCDIDAAEPAEFHRQQHRRAAKAHRCTECGREIAAGEVYSYETAMWDGSVETMKVCAHCETAREWLSRECGGFIFGGVREELEEHFHSGHKEIGRLVVMMNNEWERVRSRARYTVEQVARFAVPVEAA